jgi:hypothetical protein
MTCSYPKIFRHLLLEGQYGCVTLHSYHFAVEEGLPRTQVLLWVSGAQLRAVFEHVVLAEYRCHYDWRARKVTDIREGMFYPGYVRNTCKNRSQELC